MRTIRRIFITGLVISLPALITIYILGFTFNTVDSLFGNYIELYFGRTLPGLGFLVTVTAIFLVGLVATNVFGHRLIRMLETSFARLPVIKPVYSAARQIIEAFSAQRRSLFQSVVMLEYPKKGIYALAFITVEGSAEIQSKTKADVVTVFLPTTPNPTSGFLLMVPRSDLIFMDMSVEEALKLIISGGVVAPHWPPQKNNCNSSDAAPN
ncbi:MAG: DUF502 domain-containing protein [Dethiobacter sp.]|jgi:uncharacterized membrane protein|nr:DUF502 domain-containing protein [Dethiobacter sp.]